MYPVLLTLGSIKIYTFGIFLALAVIIGSFIIWREGRRQKFEEEKLLDLLLYVGIFGLVGARIYYLVFHFDDFGWNPLFWLLIFHFPGLSFIGAIIGGLFGLWIFAKKEKWSVWQIGDILVLGVSLGEAIGRLGAFFSGSAYGSLTNLPWGVPMVGLLGKRHPVQIYEGLAALLTFVILVKLKKFFEIKKLASGLDFLLYFFIFGVSRFLLEFLRGDSVYFLGWRTTQIISLVFILVSTVLLYKKMGRSVRKDVMLVIEKIKNRRSGIKNRELPNC